MARCLQIKPHMSWFTVNFLVYRCFLMYFLSFDHFYFLALPIVPWLLGFLLIICWSIIVLRLWIVRMETGRLILLL